MAWYNKHPLSSSHGSDWPLCLHPTYVMMLAPACMLSAHHVKMGAAHSSENISINVYFILPRDATYTMFFIIISALHVSGGFFAHHQELIKLYVQPWVLSCFPAVYRWCGWVGTSSNLKMGEKTA